MTCIISKLTVACGGLDGARKKTGPHGDVLRVEGGRLAVPHRVDCADFGEPSIVVNYFYHEQVKKSARV